LAPKATTNRGEKTIPGKRDKKKGLAVQSFGDGGGLGVPVGGRGDVFVAFPETT